MTFVKTAIDIARKQVFYCDANDSISEVARLLHNKNIGSILVKDGETLKGLITVNDMLRQLEKNADSKNLKAKHIMSSPVITAAKNMEIDELVDKFNKHKVSRMVLIDTDKKIAGVVRDIAVYKYMTFYKYDREAKKMFVKNYLRELY